MSRPTILRHTMPDYVMITYSCLSCDEDMEYHDGVQCTNCGLEWDDPAGQPKLSHWWAEFAEAVAPNATAAEPAHLMVFRERRYRDPHVWFLHIGCVEDTYDYTGRCVLTDAVGTDQYGEAPEVFEFAADVPHGLASTGEVTMPTGVYQVEATGPDTVRVVAVLAYAGGPDGQNLGELRDPREAVPKLLKGGELDVFEYDDEAWARERSPEFLKYWADKAEQRRRMAAYEAARVRRREEAAKAEGVD